MVDSNLETIKRAAEELDQVLGQDDNMAEWAQEKLAVVKSMLVAVKDYVVSQKSTGIDPQVDEEFNMIESVIESLAVRNQVDAEVIWEDLESLTEDELYVFAVTQEPVNEDWQKVNKKDKTDGMSKKAVASYRRENPGSKLKTAVTTKPSKLKRGSKASKRRKSYCSRSKGQMNMHNISCAKTPDKAICKARRRWNC
jgi:DNA-binding transcriptional regulator YdaS (Cro superfamily)